MDICNKSFLNIGKHLYNSDNLQSLESLESLQSLKSSNKLNKLDKLDKLSEIFLLDIYEFIIFLHNNENIQIKIINTQTMDHYCDLIDKSFIEDKKFITSIQILYFIIRDSLKKMNEDIVSILYKNKDDKCIQFNILYKTHYNSYIIPLCIPVQNIDSNEKKNLLIKKLITDNTKLKNKLNEFEVRLNTLEHKFIV